MCFEYTALRQTRVIMKAMKNCKYCGNSFQGYRAQFCEWKCYTESRRPSTMPTKYCLQCKVQLNSVYANKFCSRKCSAQHRTPRVGHKLNKEQKLKISKGLRKFHETHPYPVPVENRGKRKGLLK